MNSILKNNSLKFGYILSAILFSPSLIGRYISVDFLLSNYTFIMVILGTIVTGTLTVAFAKKNLNGEISFKQCFSTYFIMILTGLVLCATANYIFFNLITPEFVEVLKAKQIEINQVAIKSIETSENLIDEEKAQYITTIKNTIKATKSGNPYSISSLFKGTTTFTVILSIFGILISLLLKSPQKN